MISVLKRIQHLSTMSLVHKNTASQFHDDGAKMNATSQLYEYFAKMNQTSHLGE